VRDNEFIVHSEAHAPSCEVVSALVVELGSMSPAIRSRYSAARSAAVVCVLIARRSLRTGEHLAVGLKRAVLGGPPIEQRRIVLELE
jgi:hypothetical protein